LAIRESIENLEHGRLPHAIGAMQKGNAIRHIEIDGVREFAKKILDF
jgi:hypothetical protein